MEWIKELFNIDYVVVVLSVFIIMSAVIAIHSIVGRFLAIFGKPIKWFHSKDEDHDMLLEHEKKIKNLADKHKEDTDEINSKENAIRKDIEKLTIMFLDKQISDYRWEIINLADKILNGKSVSRECLKHAISVHSKYEEIIEKNGLTNGEVELSMKVINKSYLDIMEDED
jgi:hypothetical protein